jgi:hypothetical protein
LRNGIRLDPEAFEQNELAKEFVASDQASGTNKSLLFREPRNHPNRQFRFPIRQTIKKGDSFRIAVIRKASVMGRFMSPKRFPNIGSAPS